jgi:chromosome segregation ATPase
VSQARETAAGIREAIAQADHPFDDVASDVDALVAAMDTSARRAQLISSTLTEQERNGQDVRSLQRRIDDLRRRAQDADVRALIGDLEAQREATVRLRDRLERFEVGMERICASLGLLRTRLVEMSASEEEAAQRELARQSRELRERTDLLAESMAEVFAGDGDDEVELPVAKHRMPP